MAFKSNNASVVKDTILHLQKINKKMLKKKKKYFYVTDLVEQLFSFTSERY